MILEPDLRPAQELAGIFRKTQRALVVECEPETIVRCAGSEPSCEDVVVILEAYTAEERTRMRIRSNLFIRERDPGYTYEMTTEEADAAFPYLRNYWKEFGGFLAVPPGGESIAQMCQRVYLFIKKLYNDRVGERVLVITHGGTIRAFRYILEHWTYNQVLTEWHGNAPQNCSLTTYEYSQETERLMLKAYNEVLWK